MSETTGPWLIENVTGAAVVDLEHVRQFGDPTFPAHQPGTVFVLHRRHEIGLGEPRTSASGVLITAEHAGTHIDALCHQAEEMKLFDGVAVSSDIQTPSGFTALGVDTVEPILARGILLNVAELRTLQEGELISKEDLQAAADRLVEPVRSGDVVLVRTGFGKYWRDANHYLKAPGVSSAGSLWLASLKVRAVGIDNIAWDLPGYHDPNLRCTLPGHVVLIIRNGIHIIENLNLEQLVLLDKGRPFLFICLPLKVRGGTGSPVRPVAVLNES